MLDGDRPFDAAALSPRRAGLPDQQGRGGAGEARGDRRAGVFLVSAAGRAGQHPVPGCDDVDVRPDLGGGQPGAARAHGADADHRVVRRRVWRERVGGGRQGRRLVLGVVVADRRHDHRAGRLRRLHRGCQLRIVDEDDNAHDDHLRTLRGRPVDTRGNGCRRNGLVGLGHDLLVLAHPDRQYLGVRRETDEAARIRRLRRDNRRDSGSLSYAIVHPGVRAAHEIVASQHVTVELALRR